MFSLRTYNPETYNSNVTVSILNYLAPDFVPLGQVQGDTWITVVSLTLGQYSLFCFLEVSLVTKVLYIKLNIEPFKNDIETYPKWKM